MSSPSMPPKGLTDLILPSDAALTTWLTIGALSQLLIMAILPGTISALLPIVYGTYHIFGLVRKSRAASSGSYTSIHKGQWAVEIPQSTGVVMLVLGARINHPLGKVAPGASELGDSFVGMWKEAEDNRDKWGFLGRTNTLIDVGDDEAISMTWLSYWTDMTALQKFSESAAHRVPQLAYLRNKYPYMGIFHETFKAPPGSWETLYLNMPATGLGTARMPGKSGEGTEADVPFPSLLHRISRPAEQTFNRRMGGKWT